MDPLTICATVAGLVKTCGTAATTCNGLLSRYKNAPEILVSIRTECTAIKTTLSFIERLVKRDTKLLSSQLEASSPLAETLDVALSGCVFTFSILDIELEKLYDRSKNHDGYKRRDKMRYLWDEDRVKNILLHMRGLQSAVNLVLTALQTASISALIPLLQDQKAVIERVRQDTVSICENRSLQSGLTADANGQASSDNYSIFDSNIGDETFSFDDEIVNSFAYRIALKRLASKTKATLRNRKPDESYLLDEPLIDLEGMSESHNRSRINPTRTSNDQCLIPTVTSTHSALVSDTVIEDLKSLMPTFITSPSQQTNEGHANVPSLSTFRGSLSSAFVNQKDKNSDEGDVIAQAIEDDGFREAREFQPLLRKPVRASAERFPLSSRGTDNTTDAVETFDEDVTRPVEMRGERCLSDVARSSIVSEKTETPSSLEKKRQRAKLVTWQMSRGKPHIIFPPSPRIPVRVSGDFDTYRNNAAPIVSGSARDEAEAPCDYATSRYERWTGRDKGQYDRISKTKASDDEIHGSSLVLKHDYADDDTSTKAVANFQSESSRREERHRHRRRIPAAEGLTVTPLTAAAPKHHERGYSSFIHDTGSGLPRERSRRRRSKRNNQHSGHDASLIDNSETKSGDGVASTSSIEAANSRLLICIENAIRRVIMPELKKMKQEQREQTKRKGGQTLEPGHRGFPASPVMSADLFPKPSKHASSDSGASENLESSRDDNNTEVYKDADLNADISPGAAAECTSDLEFWNSEDGSFS